MQDIARESASMPEFETYLEQVSAHELARRSLIGAPVYTFISLIMLAGTPILMDYGWWAAAEAGLLLVLGAIRVGFALGFKRRYAHIGERAVIQFSILTALQSLTLGVLAAMVIWQYWAAQEVVLTIVLCAGCIAAGTSALSVRRSAHLIFLVCVLAPFGFAVFMVGGLAKAMLILGFLLLMGFLVQDGGQARRSQFQRLKAHYDDQLAIRRAALESHAKRQFLADIGHEIRTPASSIAGMASQLLKEDLDKKCRGFAEIIQKNSDALLNLVENAPGSVSFTPKLQEPQLATLNPRKCILEAIELYRFIASGKGLELISQFGDMPESIIFSGEAHLKEVLANLLGNAVENTEQGSVTLEASCRSLEDGDLCIEFCITDTGIGIPAENLQTIFDPFNPAGAKTSGKFGGGGLGLPLCKGLVEIMGGELTIESSEGRGTSVSFTMRAELDPADATWQSPEAVAASGETESATVFSEDHPHQILVVDDDQIHRQILCALLEKMGYRAHEAIDGQEAVVEAINGNYDLIFMDLRMPAMNGIEASNWIREHFKNGSDVRVIAVTGDASAETRDQCMHAGIDDFIPKPVQVENLQAILRQSAGKA